MSYMSPLYYIMILILVLYFLQATRGSVKPFVNFNAKHDAEVLRKAMKGIGKFNKSDL